MRSSSGRPDRSAPACGREGHAALSAGLHFDLLVAAERRRRLLDQLRQDLGDRLHLAHQPDALPGHQRAALDVAVDHGAAQRARPEMLDRQRRLIVGQLAAAMTRDHVQLGLGEGAGRLIDQRAHRDHLELGIHLDRRHGIARARPDERLLEAGVGDRFGGADEARAHLAAGGAHAQIGGDRLAVADAAGDEHRHLAQVRQDLLGEHAGRDRPDVPACFHAFDDQRIRARAHQALGYGEAGGEAQQPGAAVLDPRQGGAIRQTAGQHDVGDPVRAAHLDQLLEPRVHDDQIDPERPRGQRLRGGDLGGQLVRLHGAAREHAEAAGVRQRRDQAAFRDPGHRAAHQRERTAQKRRPGAPQVLQAAPAPHQRRQAASRP